MYSSALKHYGDFLKEIDVNDESIFWKNKYLQQMLSV
jgi:hypothetical protein